MKSDGHSSPSLEYKSQGSIGGLIYFNMLHMFHMFHMFHAFSCHVQGMGKMKLAARQGTTGDEHVDFSISHVESMARSDERK